MSYVPKRLVDIQGQLLHFFGEGFSTFPILINTLMDIRYHWIFPSANIVMLLLGPFIPQTYLTRPKTPHILLSRLMLQETSHRFESYKINCKFKCQYRVSQQVLNGKLLKVKNISPRENWILNFCQKTVKLTGDLISSNVNNFTRFFSKFHFKTCWDIWYLNSNF